MSENITNLVPQVLEVSGHGAVVFPPPRNNIDHQEEPWSGKVPQPVPAVSDPRNGFWCPVPNPLFNDTLSGRSLSLTVNRDPISHCRSQWPGLLLVLQWLLYWVC